MLLAGGLGLLWFAEFQDGRWPDDVSVSAAAITLVARIAADVVGAWVLISVARLGYVMARLGLARLRRGFGAELS